MLKDIKWKFWIIKWMFEHTDLISSIISSSGIVDTKRIFPFRPLRQTYSRLSDDLGIWQFHSLHTNYFVRQACRTLFGGVFCLMVFCWLFTSRKLKAVVVSLYSIIFKFTPVTTLHLMLNRMHSVLNLITVSTSSLQQVRLENRHH